MEYTEISDDVVKKWYGPYNEKFISIKGMTALKYSVKFLEEIENFQVFDDDVWLCSFPKTGTTWTQEMIWLLCNNLNYELAKQNQNDRFPFIDFTIVFPEEVVKQMPVEIQDSVKFAQSKERPRFIKSHLPFNLLPKDIQNGRKKPKIVYVYRNPKDTCVSYYNHSRIIDNYNGTLEEYCRLFLEGKVVYGPYWDNVLSYWKKRDEFDIHFIKFENLKNDLRTEIEKLCKFLKVKLPNHEEMDKLLDHLSFENMKSNPAVNKSGLIEQTRDIHQHNYEGDFMNKGKVGGYKDVLSENILKKIDEKINDVLEGTGFQF